MPIPPYPMGVYWPQPQLGGVAKASGESDKWAFADRLLKRLATQHHVNLLWVTYASVDDLAHLATIGQRYGIAVMASPSGIAGKQLSAANSPQRIAANATWSANRIGGFPGVAGYVLADEPRYSVLQGMEHYRAALQAADPTRPSAVVARTWESQLVAQHTGVDYLAMDVYPFFGPSGAFGPGTPEKSKFYYRRCITDLVSICRRTRHIPWAMPQMFQEIWGPWHYAADGTLVIDPGGFQQYRMPTITEARWEVWAALQMGARGIVFFQMFPHQQAAPLKKPLDPKVPAVKQMTPTGNAPTMLFADGRSSPQLEAVGRLFGFLSRHESLLGRMQALRYPLANVAEPFQVGSFHDPQTGQDVLIVVNDDLEKAQTAQLQLLPYATDAKILGPQGTEHRAIEPPQADQSFSSLELTLPPGEGRLLLLTPWARSSAGLIFDEDFHSRSLPSFLNIDGWKVTFAGRPWKMERLIVLSPDPAILDQGKTTPRPITLDLPKAMGKSYAMKHVYLVLDLVRAPKTRNAPMGVHATADVPAWSASMESGQLVELPLRAKTITLKLQNALLERIRLVGVW